MAATVRDLGEDRLVAAVLTTVAECSDATGARPEAPVVGAGDDAAVLPAGGATVLSTDTLVEHLDFRRDWSSGEDVGVKAAAAGLADVVAMGAVPEAVLVSLTVPAATHVDWVLALARGAARECARAGAAVIGGDVAAGGEIVVTVTATGRLPPGARPVLRSGARVGDAVALAGAVGESAAGLALLTAGSGGDAAALRTAAGQRVLARHRRPEPPYRAGPAAGASGATSMIDVSDGLVRDARRVAAASGVAIDLDPDRLSPDDAVAEVARALGADPVGWVLTGGEDHALLATFPAGTRLPEGYRPVGNVVPAGDADVLVAGRPWSGRGGFTHFGG